MPTMGDEVADRIHSNITIRNPANHVQCIKSVACISTGVANLVLPVEWRERLGNLHSLGHVTVDIGSQRGITGEICGPVLFRIEGFRRCFTEVLFVDMVPATIDEEYEPLVGTVPIEQSGAIVDPVLNKLVPAEEDLPEAV